MHLQHDVQLARLVAPFTSMRPMIAMQYQSSSYDHSGSNGVPSRCCTVVPIAWQQLKPAQRIGIGISLILAIVLLASVGVIRHESPTALRLRAQRFGDAARRAKVLAIGSVRAPHGISTSRHTHVKVTDAVVEQDTRTLRALVAAETKLEDAIQLAAYAATASRGTGAKAAVRATLSLERDLAAEKVEIESAVKKATERVEMDVASLHGHPLMMREGVPMSKQNKELDKVYRDMLQSNRREDAINNGGAYRVRKSSAQLSTEEDLQHTLAQRLSSLARRSESSSAQTTAKTIKTTGRRKAYNSR